MGGLDFLAAAKQDVRGCLQHLKNLGTKAGVTGFCMGGALTLLTAALVEEADVAICFYGIPPDEAADLSSISIPLQCHFAETDDWCTPETVAALEDRLKRGNVVHELYRYPAQHAFMNGARPEVYDEACATKAWKRTEAFLSKHL